MISLAGLLLNSVFIEKQMKCYKTNLTQTKKNIYEWIIFVLNEPRYYDDKFKLLDFENSEYGQLCSISVSLYNFHRLVCPQQFCFRCQHVYSIIIIIKYERAKCCIIYISHIWCNTKQYVIAFALKCIQTVILNGKFPYQFYNWLYRKRLLFTFMGYVMHGLH